MNDNLPFQEVFVKVNPGGISISNTHLLILDGHGFNVTLKTIEQTKGFGLYMVILPSHTSRAFQHFVSACFKPFKTSFIRERNKIMVTRNYIELDKITLARWVNKALNQTFTRKNIIFGSTRIWPFNPKAIS
jgi:hypothetical protein